MIQINLFPGQEQTCQHTEQTCGHRKKGREDGMNWESSTDIHTIPCVQQKASGKLLCSTGSSAGCSVMTYRGRREAQEGGDICTHTADSLHCTSETNTTS